MGNEIWEPVMGFGSSYEVSNLGRVRSKSNPMRYRPNQKPRILKQFISKFGYCQITFSISGHRFLKRVNRLVAEAFIDNHDLKPCVNHINGDKLDNSVENLEWATYSENEQHSYSRLGKNIKGIKKKFDCGINRKAKPVFCIETGIEYKSIGYAAKTLRLHRSNILKQIKGEIKKTGGYSFHF